ncbi:hypothetical protein AAEX63_13285 [Luteococcus sp. H138]|uniref:hypothetical protein n=1 Tax=unclassified Luteococcus TaxID=2639923 RepID=UPI00313DAB5D
MGKVIARRSELDPSRLHNPFADRLSEAISARGLSLARIHAHLKTMGPAVSVAALSYWATGRSLPTRSRSLEVVRSLEQVLQVEPGWLVSVMPSGSDRADLASILRREELLQEWIQKYDLPSSEAWNHHAISHTILIGPSGAERGMRTRLLMTAAQPRAQRWAVVVESADDAEVLARGCSLAPPRRQVRLAPDLTAVEFGLDEPIERGRSILVSHEVDFAPTDVMTDASGYGLRRPAEYLILEVVFEGQVPARVRRMFRPPGEAASIEIESSVLISANTAQAVVDSPAAGLHYLCW